MCLKNVMTQNCKVCLTNKVCEPKCPEPLRNHQTLTSDYYDERFTIFGFNQKFCFKEIRFLSFSRSMHGFTGGASHLSGGLELTAVPSPDVIVGGIPSCVSFGGIQLVWHFAELASEKLIRLRLMSSLQSACNNQALQPFSVLLTLIVLCIPVTQGACHSSVYFGQQMA